MFLRLATGERDEDSGQGRGVFTFAYELLRGGDLTREDLAELEALLAWFEKNAGGRGRRTGPSPRP